MIYRYLPPKIKHKKSQIKNSENTTLFLLSCYLYIFISIVLSVGPPFRRSMAKNLPYVVTVVATLCFVSYMLFDPAHWLFKLMQLTEMDTKFDAFILALGVGFLAISMAAERWLFPKLAWAVGWTKRNVWPRRRKKRKEYKVIAEGMRT